MALFTNPFLLAALFGHFTVDVLNGQRAVIFTYLSVPLGLSITELGIYSTIYVVAASLMQPVFGYLTDKIGPRWVMGAGIFWMGSFYAAGLTVPGMTGLWLLVVASLGSGAFHPAGTMQATLIGRRMLKGRETTSASYFFLFGQLGLFIGPILSGLVLDASGTRGLLWVCALALPSALYALFSGKALKPVHQHDSQPVETTAADRPRVARFALVAIALLGAFQAWAQANMNTFLPKHLELLGKTPAQYGLMTALFMGGSAAGNVIGGNLADRFGKRRVASISLMFAVLPITAIALVGWSPWLYVLIPLSGFFTGATHTIIVVLAQRIIPSGMGLASGLILGFMFSAGALGAMLSGYFADLWGMPLMFGFTAALVAAGSWLARSLPET